MTIESQPARTPLEQLPKNDKRVLDLIPFGMDRLRPTKEIAELTGFEERAIRNIVSRLIIKHGYVIGALRYANHNGYFRPVNDSQRMLAIRSIDSQIRREQRRLNVLMYGDLEEG